MAQGTLKADFYCPSNCRDGLKSSTDTSQTPSTIDESFWKSAPILDAKKFGFPSEELFPSEEFYTGFNSPAKDYTLIRSESDAVVCKAANSLEDDTRILFVCRDKPSLRLRCSIELDKN